MKRFTISIFMGLLLIVLVSCSGDSETMSPKVPEFSWAPEITLGPVGFQRFEISISPPPEDLREHIRSYTVRAVGINGTSSTFSDLVDVTNLLFRQNYSPLSEVLEENGVYCVRVTVLYSDGTQLESNSVEFTVPETKGEILSEQKIPNLWNNRVLSGMVIYGNSFFQFNGTNILEYDAESGEVHFIELDDDNSIPVKLAPLGEQKAIIWQLDPITGTEYRYQILSLSTLTFADPIELKSGANARRVNLLCANDSLLLIYEESFTDISQRDRRFKLYYAETGELKQASSTLPSDQSHGFGFFEWVGDTIWRAYSGNFDSRLQRIDLTTGEILEELALPVLNFDALQHYAGYFWLRENKSSMENATRALKVIPEAF